MTSKLPPFVSPYSVRTFVFCTFLAATSLHGAPSSKKAPPETPATPEAPAKSSKKTSPPSNPNTLPLPIADEPALINPSQTNSSAKTPSNTKASTPVQLPSSPFIEYQRGELPIIFTAPHGGREKPEHIPDRTTGIFAFDANTEELARTVAEVFQQRSGKAPHLLICKLARTKLDCNRELAEGAGNQADAINAWNAYHRSIEASIETILKTYPAAILIDLHGHSHKAEHIEIGYCHNPRILSLTEPEFNQPTTAADGSIAAFAKYTSQTYVDLIRGPLSLGSLLEKSGFPSTPSFTMRLPPPPYFNGGYTTRTYGKIERKCAAIQLETNYNGVRDNEANRTRFANALFDSLQTYLSTHSPLSLPPKK